MEAQTERLKPRIYINDTMYDLTNTGTDHLRSEVEPKSARHSGRCQQRPLYMAAPFGFRIRPSKGVHATTASLWTDHTRGRPAQLSHEHCAIHDCLPVTQIEAELLQRSIHFEPCRWTSPLIPFLPRMISLSHEGIYHRLTEILRKDANPPSLHRCIRNFVLPRDYLFALESSPIYIQEDASAEETQSSEALCSGLPVLGHDR